MDVFDLYAKISLDTSEYSKGLSDAEKQTSTFGKTLGNGIASFAKVGATALAGVTAAVGGVSALFVKGASDIADYGDNIDKMSQKLGISATAYQEWDAVLKHSGTSIDSMSRGMQTLQKNAVNSADKFEKLGITQEQLAEMSTEELFAATIEGLQNMGEGAERAALASELLGGSAKELGALLNTSAEDTKAMRDRVHELGGVMSDEAVKAAAKYQDTLQDMQTALAGVKRGVQADFLPAITTVMEGLTELFSGGDGFAKIDEGINLFTERISEALPKVVEAGTKIVLSLTQAIANNLPTIVESIVKVIGDNASTILKAGESIIMALGGMIYDGIPKVFDFLVKSLKSFISRIPQIMQGIRTILPKIVSLVTGVVENIVEQLPDILEALFDALPDILDMIFDIVVENGSIIINALGRIVNMIVQALPRLITAIANALPRMITSIIRVLPQIITMIVQALVDNLPVIIQGIVTLVTEIVKQLPTILAAIVDGIIKFGPQLAKGMITALGSIVTAIPQIVGQVWEVAKSIGAAIIDGINAFFEDPIGNLEIAADWISEQIFGKGTSFADVKDAFTKWWNNDGPGALSAENWDDILAGVNLMLTDVANFWLEKIFGKGTTVEDVKKAFTLWWNEDGLGKLTSADWDEILGGLSLAFSQNNTWLTDMLFGAMGGTVNNEAIADFAIGAMAPINDLMAALDNAGIGWNNFWSGVAGTWNVGNAITAIGGTTLQFDVRKWVDSSIFDQMKDGFDTFTKWWDEGWNAAYEVIIDMYENYKSPIGEIWESIKASFPVGEAYDWGVELVEGFFAGIFATLPIYGAGSAIANKAQQAAGGSGAGVGVVSPAFSGSSKESVSPSYNPYGFSTPESVSAGSSISSINAYTERNAASMDRVLTALESIAENGTNITLAGDAAGIFRVVDRENRIRTQASGYNKLAMKRV